MISTFLSILFPEIAAYDVITEGIPFPLSSDHHLTKTTLNIRKLGVDYESNDDYKNI
jgi:hypothetical protein